MKRQTSVAADWGRQGRRVAPKDTKGNSVRKENKRRFWRFVACSGIFVALVAAKLLLPGKMEPLSEVLSDALQKNIDVQAVFSAVGDLITQETDADFALSEVYQAVFAPQSPNSAQMGVPVQLPERGVAWDVLRSYGAIETTEDSGTAEVYDLAYLIYSDENLPKDVTLSQEILGFDYCAPISGTISSEFGYREHPVEGEERFHYGIDLAADEGTAIACFADGTVTGVGESSSYGKYCIVAHENGYQTLYAHCHRITISAGSQVLRGEKIAEVGATGIATGSHLHFELQRDGIYLNPIYYVGRI